MNSSSAGNGGNHELPLSATQIAELFPFHLVVDRELRIREFGRSLSKVFPTMRPGDRLAEHLNLERPQLPLRFDEIAGHSGSLFIFGKVSGRLRLRGQMVVMPHGESIAFLCSPWLTEPGELRSSGLTFEDFPLHDSMPEFMNVVQAQRLSMEDLRRLSEKLREQREALKLANRRAMEQAAEARQLALIAARTDNGVVITDAEGRIQWVNEGFERITGFSLDEARGRTPGSFLQGPETSRATVEYIRRQVGAGLSFNCELVNYNKAGRRYWIAVEAQPILDESGRVTNFMAIESDVTARKDADFRRDLAYSVTTILAEAKETGSAMQRILETIVTSIGYHFGVVWRLRPDTGRLYPARLWSRPDLRNSWFEIDTRKRSFARGEGLPGVVWEQNGPHWIPEIADTNNFPRKQAASLDGLRSCFAFPIRIGGEARGVIEFLSRGGEEPDAELLRMLTALGNQIGQFMERQDAESERHRLVGLLHSTLESSKDGILVVDLEKRFVTWNQRLLRLWNIDENLFLERREAALRFATGLVANPDEFVRRLDWWYRHPLDGGEDLIQMRDGRVLQRATQPQIADGEVIGRIFSYRDVTDSWRAEEALRESEERYRVITSTASDGIITVDAGNRIVFANEAAEKMFQYEPGSLTGLSLHTIMGDVYRPLGVKELMRIVRRTLGKDSSHSVEIVGRKQDGEQIPLEVSLGKSRLQGKPAFTGVIRDITERRRAEERSAQAMREIEAANQAKSDFLASMSHEIRTPLNSIAGLSELLREAPLGNDQREMANTIWAASESLLNLINDLLDFSKIEAGQIEIANEEFDPVLVGERAVEIASSRAQRKGIALTFAVHPASPPRMVGDANRLSQILLNLITNGIKFTERGSVSLDLEWCQDGDRINADFRVRDTGIGISARDRERVFEKFFRVDTAVGRRAGGTGLGLSIARLLAVRMGGTLSLEDSGSPGSSFRLSLSLPAGVAPVDAPASAGLNAVLVAQTGHVALLEKAWRSIGLTLFLFTSCEAASAWLESDQACDVVLLDDSVARDELNRRPVFHLMEHPRARNRVVIRYPENTDHLPPAPGIPRVTLDFPLTPRRMAAAIEKAMESADSRTALPVPAGRPPVSAGPAGRVLLVEDNPDSQAYALRVLHRAGHNVVVADTVARAVECVRSMSFDVIFMDVMLPDGNGFDAARQIRELERTEGRAREPIVALTANAMQEYRDRAFEADMDDYLTKPVRPEALSSAVTKWNHATAVVASEKEIIEVDVDLADLIPGYLEKASRELEGIDQPTDAGAFEQVRRMAHNLKGSGAAYGFPEITRLAQQLETAARERDGLKAAELAALLRDYVRQVHWRPSS